MSFFLTLKELKELNPSWISLKRLNFFVEYMTQRIENFFSIWLKELFLLFFSWFKYLDLFHINELNLLFHVTQILELFWKFLIQRNGPFFFKAQSFFIKKKKPHRIEFWNPTHRIDIFCELNRLISWIWRKELNRLISWIWRKDLNPFSNISLKELNSFLKRWLNEFNSFWKCASKNLTLFLIRLKELNFFMNMTQRFFRKKLWLKESKFSLNLELNFFFFKKKNHSKYWFFKNMTHRIATFRNYDSQNWIFECDSKNWTFWKYDSQNWTFFFVTQKNWTLFFFEYDSKNWTCFWMTQRI